MKIKMGDGFKTAMKGKCSVVGMEIRGFKITVETFLFEMGELDVAVGRIWLKTLGDTIVKWRRCNALCVCYITT